MNPVSVCVPTGVFGTRQNPRQQPVYAYVYHVLICIFVLSSLCLCGCGCQRLLRSTLAYHGAYFHGVCAHSIPLQTISSFAILSCPHEALS